MSITGDLTGAVAKGESLFTHFVGFLNHYSNELQTITSVLGTLVAAVPIDNQDKSNIQNLLEDLTTAVSNIQNSVSNMSVPSNDVVVKESDIETAVRNIEAQENQVNESGAS